MSDPWIGRTISKVRLERRIGHGGMAEVYLGLHTTLNRPVAVKLLLAHLTADDALFKRFVSEAQAVAAMRHPNIVQVFDFDVLEGRPYIVMELLEGMTLDDYLRRLDKLGHILPLPIVARLMKSLASALDYAHTRGIVHRDVKPANVILRAGSSGVPPDLPLPPEVEPILTDFGVAHITDASTRTATGTVIGTPAYMSPEQIRGESIDARSDIYSLGIMLYEMLSGELPFVSDSDTPASLLYKQVHETAAPLPNTTQPVQNVVARALMKDRQARYQHAGELARELEAATGVSLGDATTQVQAGMRSKPPSIASSGRRPISLKWLLLGGLGLGGMMALAALAIFSYFYLSRLGVATPEPAPIAAVLATAPASDLPTAPETPAPATAPAAAPSLESTGPVGEAFFRDSTFRASIPGLSPAPVDTIYHGWLTREDGDPVRLDAVDDTPGSLAFEYQSDDPNLLAHISGFVVSIEPRNDPDPAISAQIVCHVDIEPETTARLQLFDEVTRGAAPSSALLDRLEAQAGTYDVHLGYSVEGATSNNLAGAKVHAEHVVNIAGGRLDEAYGDWNADGLTQNPGDDVGLLGYLFILDDYARSVLASRDASQEARDLADQIIPQVRELSTAAEHGRDVAERIAAADSLDEVQPLASELAGLKVRSAVGTLVQTARSLDLTLRFDVLPGAP
ncbi:MAG TPA: serine/threonine-protein kinase [Anaerolineales bacterium]|nr:serine/threonine-protein kinase [Anaerolineales bacterium]